MQLIAHPCYLLYSYYYYYCKANNTYYYVFTTYYYHLLEFLLPKVQLIHTQH